MITIIIIEVFVPPFLGSQTSLDKIYITNASSVKGFL